MKTLLHRDSKVTMSLVCQNPSTRLLGLFALLGGCVFSGCQATGPAAHNSRAASFAANQSAVQNKQAGQNPDQRQANLKRPAAAHPAMPQDPSEIRNPKQYVAQAAHHQTYGSHTAPVVPAIANQPMAGNGTMQAAPPRLPSGNYYGNFPVAVQAGQAAPAGGHGPGCACCNQGKIGYQPVYTQQMFSDASASCNAGCNASGAGAAAGFGPVILPPNYTDPQEWIYDGGDQPPAVRIREDYSLIGLGPEDTVVEFTTQDGREFAETGCRAAIYAPRFASIRRVTSYGLSDGVLAAKAARLDVPPVAVNAPIPTTQVAERAKIGRDSSVLVAEAFRERNRGVPLLQNHAPLAWVGNFAPFENMNLIKLGLWDETELVAVRKGTAAAAAWSNIDELVVLVKEQRAELIRTTDKTQELVSYKLGEARIRLCKVASQQTADVGDIVDFTIRFDNTAEQTLSDLVIHDSLPPRLEYVPNSEQSSLAASFEVVPNEVGSETLRWTIKDSIEPGHGGIIRFQCKVR